jgi:hypothetical protein
VQVLAFLEEIRGDQHQRVPWHPKLLHKAAVYRAPHTSDGLLRAEESAAEFLPRISQSSVARVRQVYIDDQIVMRGDKGNLIESSPPSLLDRDAALLFEHVEVAFNAIPITVEVVAIVFTTAAQLHTPNIPDSEHVKVNETMPEPHRRGEKLCPQKEFPVSRNCITSSGFRP